MDLSKKTKASFWTVKEIVEYTGWSESTVWRLLAAKKLDSIKLEGSRSRKIKHSQLVDYLGFDPLDEPDHVESILRRRKKEDSNRSKDNFPLFALIEPDRN